MSKYIKKNKKKAFTLVEILIVVAVIGILFVALVPRIDFAGDKARETAVKNDFRSFELAAEQYLREKGGVSELEDISALCSDTALNMYLDGEMQFDDSGHSYKFDPWSREYNAQFVKPLAGNPNNGAIVFICNGRDNIRIYDDDNYVLAVTYIDGNIESQTIGFSSNIEGNMSITGGSATSMSIISGTTNIVYKITHD